MHESNRQKPLITFFVGTLLGGGAEKVIINITKCLLKMKKTEVDLLLQSNEIAYEVPTGANVFILGSHARINTLQKPTKKVTWLASIRDVLKKIKPLRKLVMIVDHMCHTPLNILKLISYVKQRKPDVIVTFGGNSVVSLLTNLLYPKFKCVVRLDANTSHVFPNIIFNKLFLHRAYKVISVSKGVEKNTIRINPKLKYNTSTIYNPIFDQEILDKSLESVSHAFFAESNKAPVLLHVGRFDGIAKNHELLITAFKEATNCVDLRLILLGTGPNENNIRKLVSDLGIENKVSFEGFQNNPYAYMKQVNLVVLSSKSEALPNVLIEAMACGTNVVSTDCACGPREILDNGKYGTLTPVGDYKALAEGIIGRLNNPLPSEMLVERAKFFSVEKSANEHLKLFNL